MTLGVQDGSTAALLGVPTALLVTLLLRLGVALALGTGIAALHLRLRARAGGAPLGGALAMLAPLIALVVWAIGGDIARAFGLVGVLAIVRFRTVVRDPADSVFVLFSVAAGVTAAAAEHLAVPVAGTLALALGLLALERLGPRYNLSGAQRRLVVRVAAQALPAVEAALAGAGFTSVRLAGLEALKGGGVVDARFTVRADQSEKVDRLVLRLAALDGVVKARSFSPRG